MANGTSRSQTSVVDFDCRGLPRLSIAARRMAAIPRRGPKAFVLAVLGLEEIGKVLIKDWEVDPQPQAKPRTARFQKLKLTEVPHWHVDV